MNGNGSFGDGTLFREIGNTLESIGQEVILGTVSSLKTAVARRVVATQEGQAVAAESFTTWIPLLVLGIIAFFLLRRVFAR
jgi:hypothetical protein